MECRATLEQLKLLAKNKQIRKSYPRFYRLLKEQIKAGERIIRLDAIVKREQIRYSKLAIEIDRYAQERRRDN